MNLLGTGLYCIKTADHLLLQEVVKKTWNSSIELGQVTLRSDHARGIFSCSDSEQLYALHAYKYQWISNFKATWITIWKPPKSRPSVSFLEIGLFYLIWFQLFMTKLYTGYCRILLFYMEIKPM